MNIVPLLTFYIINSQTQFLDRDINHEIASSLLYVIEKFFTPRSSSFVFILSCQRQHTMNFYKDLMEILFGYLGNIKTQIEINNEVRRSSAPRERIYNLILVDSSESFLKLDLASRVQNYDTNEFYHIFLQNRDKFLADDIQRILDYCWAHYIINVNVQVQLASGEIIVYTYFPFTASQCGGVWPVEVNRFLNGSMKNDDLFPSKVTNMHGCPLKVATWSSGVYMQVDLSKRGYDSVGGLEGRLLRRLSKKMNFEIQVVTPPNNENRGISTGNKSTGAIGMLQERKADISLGYFWFTHERARLATPASPHFQSSNVATLLASSSNFKLIHSHWCPFKPIAFAAIVTAFFMTLGVLFVLSKMHRMSQFFGRVVLRNIGLNHIAWTLGLSTVIKPWQSWVRVFVMSWMMFSFVIRTHYGAVLFHIMKNNLFGRTPSTLDELARFNYTVVVTEVAYKSLNLTNVFTDTGLRHMIIPKDPKDDGGALTYIEQHPNDRLTTIGPVEMVLQYLVKYHKGGILKVLKEPLMIQNSCIYFTKHSFLVDHANQLLQQITSVGLIDAWMKMYFYSFRSILDHRPVEMTIGMIELYGIFYICGMMLGVSLVVFCLEIISVRVKWLASVFVKKLK